ncbi:MAG: efflux RND transporter permease subunit [Planctomycetes bacterium]|nr:efflux RND transporter permease subunit [Planctomycetota bacterium]MCB9869719.1 efflux RND transporter permease subunit [Planctomycetota bacterium]
MNPATDSPNDTSPRGGLFGLLVDRPVLTAMLTLALVLVGTLALIRLPLTFMGDGMTTPNLNVWVPITQARSPRESEDKVARPTEEMLRTIPGIRRVRSQCHSSGVRIRVELDQRLDPSLAAAEIRDRIQRAMLEWPEGVDRYFTWREDGSSAPLVFFQILTPEDNSEWQAKVENVITPRIEAVDGVGRVDIFGMRSESVRIWFDRDKLFAHRIDYRNLLRRLAEDNVTEPAGELEGRHERVILRVDSRFRSLVDIEEYPVRPGVRIKDIARVVRDRRSSSQFSRFNERFTFTGSIRGTSDANPVATSARIRAAAEELKADPRLSGIDFRYLFDQGQFIESSLDSLLQSTFKGGLLALVMLFLFLHSFRSTLVIGLSIPLTLLAVAGYLFFTGDSLNILTMTGMTLAVGMVVDNSVVVLENIQRRRREGLALREACITGAQEMGLAVTMATLTTVVVFLPVIFMGASGRVRAMFSSVGVPLSVALLSSLFVALLLLPSGVRTIGGVGPGAEFRFGRWSPVHLLTAATLRVVNPSLRFRYPILILAVLYVGLIAAKVLPLPLPKLDFESGDKNPFRGSDVTIHLELPKGLNDADVHREVLLLERSLLDHKAEWQIDSISCRYGRRSIQLNLMLQSGVKPAQHADFARRIRAGLPRRPGIKQTVGGDANDNRGTEEQDMRNFVVRLRGRDSEHLAVLGLELQGLLAKHPQVEMVEVAAVTDNAEAIVDVDRNRLQELGVAPEALFGTVRGGLQGRDLTRFEEEGHEVPLVAQFDDNETPTLHDLRETLVFSNRGSRQRLGDMARIEFRKTMDNIARDNGRTTVTVLGRRAEGIGPKQFSATLRGIMSKFALPRGYEWSEDSMTQQTSAQIAELMQAGLLSVVLVFLLMGILFESLILPLAILVTIVFAALGGEWSLYLFHGSIDPMAITGLILLAGVVVNNGIVLLDCIERLRRDGVPRDVAIDQGIRIRLRPIVMTAATTVVGLLPMAIFGETSGQGVNYVSLSITVSGGLTLCTLFTAPAVSVAYAILDDFRSWIRSTVHTTLAPTPTARD